MLPPMQSSPDVDFRAWVQTIPELSTEPKTSRMNALFSDIARQKSANTSSFTSNVSWWRQTLFDLARKGVQPSHDHLALKVDEALLDAFANCLGKRPMALSSVIVHLSLVPCHYGSINSSLSFSNSQS
jgi:hypothetical protein